MAAIAVGKDVSALGMLEKTRAGNQDRRPQIQHSLPVGRIQIGPSNPLPGEALGYRNGPLDNVGRTTSPLLLERFSFADEGKWWELGKLPDP